MSEKSGDDEEMYDKDEDITERKSSDGVMTVKWKTRISRRLKK